MIYFGYQSLKTPLRAGAIGWGLFVVMYILVGALTALGVAPRTAFMLAAILGILGFFCWCQGMVLAIRQLLKGQSKLKNSLALLLSGGPLALLLFGIGMASYI